MKWEDLDYKQKGALALLYIKNGITSLDDMKKHYNSFDGEDQHPKGNYIHDTYDSNAISFAKGGPGSKLHPDQYVKRHAKGGHLYSGIDTESEWNPEVFRLTNYRAVSKPNKKQDLTINQEQRDRAMQVLQEERAKAEAGGYKANIVRAAEEAIAKGWTEDEIDFQNYMYHTLSQWGDNNGSNTPIEGLTPREIKHLEHIQAGLKDIAYYVRNNNGVDNRPNDSNKTIGNLPSRAEEKQWIEWCEKRGINPYEAQTNYQDIVNNAREIQDIQQKIDETQKKAFKAWWNPGYTDLVLDLTGIGGAIAQRYPKTERLGKIGAYGADAVDYGTSAYNLASGQVDVADIGVGLQTAGYAGAAASGIKSIKPWVYDVARAGKVAKFVGPIVNAVSVPIDLWEISRMDEQHIQEREKKN